MEKYESIPLELSNLYIEASAGFSLDIGCSTAKLLYRGKEDYQNGKPIKDELKGVMGRIFLIPSIPRTEVDDVIEIIRTKCDLRPAEGDIKPEVFTTGAGCNFFRERLETELNIRLANVKEMDCFAQAFTEMAKHGKYEDIFEATDEKTASDIQTEEQLMEKIATIQSEFGKDISKRATAEEIAAEKNAEKSVLPCLVAVCGSGAGYMRINEDGMFELCGGNVFSGRPFLGLAALTTGEKDYSRIQQAVERGSCRSVDEYAGDIVAQNKSQETKGGDKSSEDFYDSVNKFTKPVLPFGKAVTRSRDEISDDDVLHSLYRVFLRNLLNVGRLNCVVQGLKNLYLSGNFTQNPNARNMIEVHNAGENVLAPKNHRVHVKFIKNGGHLGALGAFLKNKDDKTK